MVIVSKLLSQIIKRFAYEYFTHSISQDNLRILEICSLLWSTYSPSELKIYVFVTYPDTYG